MAGKRAEETPARKRRSELAKSATLASLFLGEIIKKEEEGFAADLATFNDHFFLVECWRTVKRRSQRHQKLPARSQMSKN